VSISNILSFSVHDIWNQTERHRPFDRRDSHNYWKKRDYFMTRTADDMRSPSVHGRCISLSGFRRQGAMWMSERVAFGADRQRSAVLLRQRVSEQLVGEFGDGKFAGVEAVDRGKFDDVGADDVPHLSCRAQDLAGFVEEETAGLGRTRRGHQ